MNLDGATTTEQTFRYQFTPERNGQDYEVLGATLINGSSSDLENNALEGDITVEAGTKKFEVAVRVRAEQALRNSESLSLAVKAKDLEGARQEEAEAYLRDEDLQNCATDDGVGVSPMVRSLSGSVECIEGREEAIFTYFVELDPGVVQELSLIHI